MIRCVQGVDPAVLGPVLPRAELLDRMDGHTKDCAACSKAYRGGCFFAFGIA